MIQLSSRASFGRGAFGAINRRISPNMNHISKTPTLQQSRQLHAQWTYLLDHSWLYKNTGKSTDPLLIGRGVDGLIESDTSCEDPNIRTILFLHDAYADKTMGMSLAKSIIAQMWTINSQSDKAVPLVQGLMVNVRGSGDSSSDDYDNSHTLPNAAEDLLTAVQAACTGTTRAPSVVVAYGLLGSALAHFYVHVTANKGGVTRSVHSEVSGEGAITPPSLVLLLPGVESTTSNDTSVISEGARSVEYIYEEDVSAELMESAKEYLSTVEIESEQRGSSNTIVKRISVESKAFDLIKAACTL